MKSNSTLTVPVVVLIDGNYSSWLSSVQFSYLTDKEVSSDDLLNEKEKSVFNVSLKTFLHKSKIKSSVELTSSVSKDLQNSKENNFKITGSLDIPALIPVDPICNVSIKLPAVFSFSSETRIVEKAERNILHFGVDSTLLSYDADSVSRNLSNEKVNVLFSFKLEKTLNSENGEQLNSQTNVRHQAGVSFTGFCEDKKSDLAVSALYFWTSSLDTDVKASGFTISLSLSPQTASSRNQSRISEKWQELTK